MGMVDYEFMISLKVFALDYRLKSFSAFYLKNRLTTMPGSCIGF
jgi:hypothetical protein